MWLCTVVKQYMISQCWLQTVNNTIHPSSLRRCHTRPGPPPSPSPEMSYDVIHGSDPPSPSLYDLILVRPLTLCSAWCLLVSMFAQGHGATLRPAGVFPFDRNSACIITCPPRTVLPGERSTGTSEEVAGTPGCGKRELGISGVVQSGAHKQ